MSMLGQLPLLSGRPGAATNWPPRPNHAYAGLAPSSPQQHNVTQGLIAPTAAPRELFQQTNDEGNNESALEDGNLEQEERVESDGPPMELMAGGCCCCCFFIILIIVLSGMKGLSANQYGLSKNKISNKVDFSQVYDGGRRYLGPWSEYVTFPSYLQTIDYSRERVGGSGPGTKTEAPFKARTSEGMQVELSVTIQYFYNKAFVAEIYKEYKKGFPGYVTSNMRSKFTTLISKYKQSDLWEKRQEVVAALKATCIEVATGILTNWVTCWGVQLHEVHLDSVIESKIEGQQVQKQNQIGEEKLQLAAQYRAATEVTLSEKSKEITVVNAEAAANSLQIVEEAKTNVTFNYQVAGGEALTVVDDTLKAGFTAISADTLNSYFLKAAIIKKTNSHLLYGDFNSYTSFRGGDL